MKKPKARRNLKKYERKALNRRVRRSSRMTEAQAVERLVQIQEGW
jgi:hypothetical protein